jgi:molecular chaperone HtpG
LPEVGASTEAGTGESLPQPDFEQLVERFKSTLGDRILDARESKRLTDSPCRLVSPEGSPDRDLYQVRRLIEQEFEVPKKILELNRRHPLIQNLARLLNESPEETLINTAIEQLFDNALLLEGLHPNPADMTPRIQMLMEAAIASRAEN